MTNNSDNKIILGNETDGSILVTGASGLVGSHLIKKLLSKGRKVKALYRRNIPEINTKADIDWVKGDILDVISLSKAMEGVDLVYHCAAIVSFNPNKKDLLLKTNIEGTANVVNTAIDAGVKKLCYVSSVAALGKSKPGQYVTETVNWSEETNNSNYGKSKYLSEAEVWRGIAEGLAAVIVNPVIILGAGDWNDGSSKIFKSAYNEFPWYTEGVTGFVDVMDVAEAMVQLTESNISGERFILSSENRAYKDVFTSIARCFGKKPPTKKVTPLVANLAWRVEAIKSLFTKQQPLLTKETSDSAQRITYFDNSKIQKYLPNFKFTSVDKTIERVCRELEERYNLKV